MRRLLCAIAVTALISFGLRAANDLHVYVIDVEGGGASLIVTPSGQSMLVDSGSPPPAAGERDSKRIAAAMEVAGLKKINYLFTTHYDVDHVGGAVAANAVAHFDRFFDHGDMDSTWEQNRGFENRWKDYLSIAEGKRTIVKPGDLLPLEGVRVEVVSAAGQVLPGPINGGGAANPFCQGADFKQPDKTENSQSAGLLLTYQKFTMLNVGDLTWDKEMALACPQNKLGRVNLYIATHHGFFNEMSGSPAHVWSLQPQVVIAADGPRKGMAAVAYDRIMKVPQIEGLWQAHLALATDAAHNTPEEMIANLEASADCQGHWIRVDADSSGSFSVFNSRNSVSKNYRAR